MKPSILLVLPALLCSCAMIPADDRASSAAQIGTFERESQEWRGQKFARNRCSDCHGVEPWQTSPVSAAPSFEAVANAPGLTKDTLTQWLHRSHDYPREMYFEIPAAHIDDLVAYMLTLRREDYEPVT